MTSPPKKPSSQLPRPSLGELEAQSRYRLLEALTQAEQKATSRIESLTEVIFETDLEGRITFLNSSFDRLLGHSRDLQIYEPLEDLILEAHRPRYRASVERATKTQTPQIEELVFIHQDGRTIWTKLHIQANPSPEPVILGSIHDISALRSSQEEIRTMNRMLEQVVQSVQAGVLFEDNHRNIRYTNEAFLEIWKINESSAHLIGRPCASLAEGLSAMLPSPEEFGARVEQLVQAGQKFAKEEIKLSDGRILERDYIPIFDGHRCVGHYWQYQDVTKERKIRAHLREGKEAAQAESKTMSEFLAVMSHEIRTPLNALLGMSDLMASTQLSADQSRFLRSIQSNSEMLLALINDVLDVSKLEANELVLESASFDLGELVEDVAEALAGRAEEKDIQLVVYRAPDLPQRVKGDAARTRQILLNLVGNAIKFTLQGHVYVSIDGMPGPNGRFAFELKVEDTGIGIAKEDQAQVFQRFYQCNQSTNRQFGGTGLGLDITGRLVSMMGGHIDLKSAPNQGSLFTVRLTLDIDAPPAPKPRWDSQSPTGATLEPHEFQRSILHRNLNSLGLGVTECLEFKDMLEMLEQRRLGYLIIDERKFTKAPKAHKERLLREAALQKINPILIQPIGALPSHLGTELKDFVLLSKPIRRSLLLQAVQKSKQPRTSGPEVEEVPARPQVQAKMLDVPILVVEDNAENQFFLEHVLRAAGARVFLANNGDDGLERARRNRFELIIMDIEMPGMDGLECTRKIRAMEQAESKERTPILALTAHALREYRLACFESGMDDYLTKPINRQHLVDVVYSWIVAAPTILVVDDSMANRLLLERILRSESKYRVLQAQNGEEAISMANCYAPSAVLLDVELPDMKGWEVAAAIREQDSTQNTPIVALTGHDDRRTKANCLAAGCTDYLRKPIRKNTLFKVLERLVGETPQRPRSMRPLPTTSAVPVDPDIADLVPVFLNNRRQELPKLQRALESKDFDALEKSGHNMKGTGASYGHPRISQLGAMLETSAKECDPQQLASTLGFLRNYLDALPHEP